MKFSILLFSLLQFKLTSSIWTVDCNLVTVERSDPIVSPGTASNHMHVVAGSSAFSNNSSNADLRTGSCTSCDVKQDKSAYWTPRLYVARPDLLSYDQDSLNLETVAAPVPFKSGGFIVYYKLIGEKGERASNDVNHPSYEPISPFPENFRLLVSTGMIKARSEAVKNSSNPTTLIVSDLPVNFKCLDGGQLQLTDTEDFPEDPRKCVNGIRAQLTFPSCWDGRFADTRDHFSHVSYPVGHWGASKCPNSHPIRIPTLFFENIYILDSPTMARLDQGWKFVWPAMAKNTGRGGDFHADFMNGWDQDFLSQAISNCGISPCTFVKKEPNFTCRVASGSITNN